MLQRAALAATAVAFSAFLTEAAPAQPTDPQPPAPSQDERMERLERRLDELDRKHQEELKARDEEIARLRSGISAPVPPVTQPSPPADDEIERTKREILDDIEQRHETSGVVAPRSPANLNPDISIFADLLSSYSPDRENDAYNRFDIRELEVDFRAAVHPRADGVLTLTIERDVENPIFAEEEGEEEEGGPENSINVEEAYLLIHDPGVPNLTAKVGRFYVRFGRHNLLHLHNFPVVDPPFVNQAFLGPETFGDVGASLSYVIPPDRIGGQYVELIGEVISGEGAGSESPTLRGDLTVDSPAFNAHVLWNTDLPRDVNFELGGSWLNGHADADNSHDVNLLGVDATLMFRDPTGGFRNALLQAEAMYAIVDNDEGTEQAFGAYVLGQQQFTRDVYAGLRVDWTEDPNDDSSEAWGLTPYATWHWTESLRFRVSYQHRDGDRPTEDAVYFQLTWMFGAHASHPYWASF